MQNYSNYSVTQTKGFSCSLRRSRHPPTGVGGLLGKFLPRPWQKAQIWRRKRGCGGGAWPGLGPAGGPVPPPCPRAQVGSAELWQRVVAELEEQGCGRRSRPRCGAGAGLRRRVRFRGHPRSRPAELVRQRALSQTGKMREGGFGLLPASEMGFHVPRTCGSCSRCSAATVTSPTTCSWHHVPQELGCRRFKRLPLPRLFGGGFVSSLTHFLHPA